MPDTTLRPALPREAERISALAIRSKAHWGYSPEQMQVFSGELTLRPDELVPRNTHVLMEGDALLGFYTLVDDESDNGPELEHLFLDPSVLKQGLGTRLLRHAQGLARARRFSRIRVQSDPNAAGFYRALNYRHLRDVPSSIPGRSIPIFELALEEPGRSPGGIPDWLDTERLLLNAPHPDYAEAIVQGVTESFRELQRWMPWADQIPSLDGETARLAESRRRHEQDLEATFFVFRREDGLFLGAIGIPRMDWEQGCFEIGYWIRTSRVGNGYASEALRTLATFAFRELSARRVEVRMSDDNQPSRQVAEAVGCRLEQILDGDGTHPDGSPRNTRVYLATAPTP